MFYLSLSEFLRKDMESTFYVTSNTHIYMYNILAIELFDYNIITQQFVEGKSEASMNFIPL